MAPGTSRRPVPAVVAGLAMLVAIATACGPVATPDGGASPAAAASPGARIEPSPSVARGDAPPDAALSVEGGDPVTGQLGTYVWFDSGSDSPWLPGTPLTVGAGEPLTVTFAPDSDVRSWVARCAPAAAQGPAGAVPLGAGAGSPAFAAPETGTWTLEVVVEFLAGAGQASYFWRLEVE